MRNRDLVATAVAFLVSSTVVAAGAQTTPAAGYLYVREVLPELTEGCVAHAPGGVYVGVGPALAFPPAGATRSIVFRSESGDVRTVATGLNSIGDCVYDAVTDTLYVTDSGAEFSGAATGDTVFAIPGGAEDEPIQGHELLEAGTIPYAFSIALTAGGLLVSDAAGAGVGSVIAIDLTDSEPVATTFASGFDYTGGVAVDGDRVLVGEALDPSFESVVYAYAGDGAFDAVVSGPTYAHGSNDLAVAADGSVLATGGSTLVAIDDQGGAMPLVTGLVGGGTFPAFGGGVSVDPFTGRIDFLASSFTGDDDDKGVHRLVPIDRLITRGGDPATDCTMELYGVELVPRREGRPARAAICTDGAACDADGRVDGGCTFPLGLCFNVEDARLPECTPASVATVRLQRAKPEGAGAEALAAAASQALPAVGGTCVFGDGIRVELRDGGTRAGKGRVKFRAASGDVEPQADIDAVRMICEPAS